MRQRYVVKGHGKPCPYETNRRGMACRALLLSSHAQLYLRATLLLVLCVALAGGSSPEVSHAQEGENHAGLVVQFSDGTTHTYCLPFTGESITGLDLLLKTGFDITAETQGALGAWVCRIESDGCNYPEESCVCQSYGPGGKYWVYNHLIGGAWKASSKGASNYKVRNGEVDGWVWSSGKGPSVTPSFTELCAAVLPAQPEPTATTPPDPTNTLVPLPTNTAIKVLPSSTTIPPTTTPEPRLTFTPAPVPPTEQVPQPLVPTATPEPPSSTPTTLPTDTPAPTATLTLQPTSTHTPAPEPSSTSTLAPTVTPTAVIRTAGQAPQAFAQMLALGIGLAVVGGLALWWFGLRGRRR